VLAGIVVCDKEFNIIDEQYSLDKLKFPYIHGFRSYRELSAMMNAYSKIQEHIDLVLISGEGTIHPRLGIASHFSLAANVPTIGVSENLFEENKLVRNCKIKYLDVNRNYTFLF
jgi:deoxyribonuclease V